MLFNEKEPSEDLQSLGWHLKQHLDGLPTYAEKLAYVFDQEKVPYQDRRARALQLKQYLDELPTYAQRLACWVDTFGLTIDNLNTVFDYGNDTEFSVLYTPKLDEELSGLATFDWRRFLDTFGDKSEGTHEKKTCI